MRAIKYRNSGFTLIELIVTMVIVSILAAYAYARLNFTSYNTGGCSETVKSSIRLAQKMAIAKRSTALAVSVSGSCAVTVGADSYPALSGVSVTNSGTVTFNGLGQPSVGGTPLAAVRTLTIAGGGVTRFVCLEPETGYVHEESASCG
jgi:prepilin-type N-terminal cleavage/methylation domain-containing protein